MFPVSADQSSMHKKLFDFTFHREVRATGLAMLAENVRQLHSTLIGLLRASRERIFRTRSRNREICGGETWAGCIRLGIGFPYEVFGQSLSASS